MDRQLRSLGLAYERVSAVDGRTLDPAYVARFPPMAPSQIGCFLSHRTAWQRIAGGDSPYGIVLEDDIHIAAAFAQFALATDWIPPDAGIMKFDTDLWQASVDKTPHATWYGSALRRMRSFHPGAGAYVLSADAARLLLSTHAEPTEPADDALFYVEEPWRHLPPAYHLDPAVCIQDAVIPQPQDPRLASVQEIKRRRHKSLVHRTVRETRRLYRWFAAGEAAAAAAIGARPPFTRKVVPFEGGKRLP